MNALLKKNFISTKEASAISGYAADYLSRLCREGKINGSQVGRTWLIERSSLEAFMSAQVERKIELAESLAREREREYRKATSPINRVARATESMERGTREAVNIMIGAFARAPMPRRMPAFSSPAVAMGLTALVLAGSVVAAGSGLVSRAGETLASSAFTARSFVLDSATMVSDDVFAVRESSKKEIESLREATTIIPDENIASIDESIAAALSSAHAPVEPTALAYARAADAIAAYPDPASFAQVSERLVYGIAHPKEVLGTLAVAARDAYLVTGSMALSGIETVLALHEQFVHASGHGLLAVGSGARDLSVETPLAIGSTIIDTSHSILALHEKAIYALVASADEGPRFLLGTLYVVGDGLGGAVAHGVRNAPEAYNQGVYAFSAGAANFAAAISDAGYAAGADSHATVLALLEAEDRAIAGSVIAAREAVGAGTQAIAALPKHLESETLGFVGNVALRVEMAEADMLAASPLAAYDFDQLIPGGLRNITAVIARGIGSAFHGVFGPLAGFFGAGEEVGIAIIPGGTDLPRQENDARPDTATGGDVIYEGPVTIVRNEYPTVTYGGVPQTYVDERFDFLRRTLYNRIEDVVDRDSEDLESIDGLSGTEMTISTSTIIGSTFTGGSIHDSVLDVATTTVTGTLTVNGDLSVSGAVASNSTTTNLYAGTAAIDDLTATDATLTNATATNLYGGTVRIDNLSVTNSTTTNATSTNFYATAGSFAAATIDVLTAPSAIITDAVITSFTATNSTTTNATSTNFFAESLTATLATITDALFTNITATLATLTNAVITTLTATDATLTNATTTNATTTGSLALTYVTPSRLLSVNAGGTVVSSDLSSWVAGTANQVTVTDNGSGGITVSLPSQIIFGSSQQTTLSSGGATSTFGGGLTATRIEAAEYLAGPYVLATSTTATSAFSGNIAVGRDTTLGTAASDALVVNATVASNFVPASDTAYDLGSVANNWRRIYVDEVVANSLSAASTSISGTVSADFTLNSDNATNDTEDMNLVFNRGTASPNALMTWNASTKRFEFNMPVYSADGIFANATSTSLVATDLTVSNEASIASLAGAAVSSLSANYLPKWNSGTFINSLVYDSGTQVGIGASSNLDGALTVNGTIGTQSEGDIFRQYDSSSATWYPILARYDDTSATAYDGGTFLFGNGANAFVGIEQPGGADVNLFRVRATDTTFSGTTDTAGLASFRGGITLDNGDNISWRNSGDTADTQVLTLSGDTTILRGGGGTPTLRFDNSSGSPLMTLLEGGNVGIGSTNPLGKLDIAGNILSAGSALSYAGLSNTGLFNYDTVGGDLNISAYSTGGDTAIKFTTSDGGTAGVRMTINDAGNVGIGTANPGSKLTISTAAATATRSLDIGGSTTGFNYASISNTSGSLWWGVEGSSAGQVFASSLAYASLLGSSNSTALQLATNGIARMTVDASGNVGIGTTAPDAPLSFASSLGAKINLYDGLNYDIGIQTGLMQFIVPSTGNAIGFGAGSSAAFTEWMRVIDGKVGIGTAAPSSLLNIKGSNPTFTLSHTSGGTGDSTIVSTAGHSGNYNGLEFTANTANASYSSWKMGLGGNLGVLGGADTFSIGRSATGGGSYTTFMTVLNSGNVGIGETSPTEQLVVAGQGTGRMLVGDVGFGDGYTGLSMNGVLSSTNYNLLGSLSQAHLWINRASGGNIHFREANADQMTILSGGNVGIGTAGPSQKLHVNGNLLVDSFARGDDAGIFFRDGFTHNVSLSVKDWGSSNVSSDGLLMSGYDGLGFMTSENTYNAANVRMFIQGGGGVHAGNVGIGTVAPQFDLHVKGAAVGTETTPDWQVAIAKDYVETNGLGAGPGILLSHDSYLTGMKSAGISAPAENPLFSRTVGLGFWTSDFDTVRSEKMRITGSGNVGIGTTSPANPLHIASSVYRGLRVTRTGAAGSGSFIQIENSSGNIGEIGMEGSGVLGLRANSGTVNAIDILSSGNVGIGTNAPESTLEVVKNVTYSDVNTYPQLRIKSTTGTNGHQLGLGVDEAAGFSFIQSINRGIDYTHLILQRYGGNVGIGTNSPSTNLEVLRTHGYGTVGDTLLLNTAISGGINSDPTYYGSVRFSGSGYDWGAIRTIQSNPSASWLSRMAFYTMDGNGGALAERMSISNSGNVGIGTTDASRRLTVVGDGSSLNVSSFQYGSSGAITTVGATASAGRIQAYTNGYVGSAPLLLNPDGGNVGIGTTDPGNAKLRVSGGPIRIDGSTTITTNDADTFTYDSQTMTHYGLGWFGDSWNGSGATAWLSGYAGLKFLTTGLPRMSITQAGNVGIGTTAPGEKLTVQGNGAALLIQTESDPTAYRAKITSSYDYAHPVSFTGLNNTELIGQYAYNVVVGNTSGNVGINTTSPQEELQILEDGTPAEGNFGLSILSVAGDTELSMGASAASDYSYIQSFQDGISWSNRPLVLQPNDGKVGIGTTNPVALLTVGGTQAGNAGLEIVPGSGVVIQGYNRTSSAYTSINFDGSSIGFRPSGTTALMVGSTGNVAVGTGTANGFKLLVSGGSSTSLLNLVSAGSSAEILLQSATHSSFIGDYVDGVRIYSNNGTMPALTVTPYGSSSQPGTLWLGVQSVGNYTSRLDIGYVGGGTEYGIEMRPQNDNTTAIAFLNAAASSVGSITTTNAATAYNTTSDRRLKENIALTTRGIETLRQIEISDFNFKSDPGNRVQGYIAQDLYALYPEAVTPGRTPEESWSVDYGRITPLLAQSIKELDLRTLSLAPAEENTEARSLAVSADASVAGMLTVSGTGTFKEGIKAMSFLTAADSSLPTEVLTDGSADLYKMASYAIANMQEISERTDLIIERLDTIEQRLAAIEQAAQAAPALFELPPGTLEKLMASVGLAFEDGMTTIENLVAGKLTIGSAEKPVGVTLFDERTGDPYCLSIRNGKQYVVQGECEVANPTQTGVVPTSPTPAPLPPAEPVEPADTAPAMPEGGEGGYQPVFPGAEAPDTDVDPQPTPVIEPQEPEVAPVPAAPQPEPEPTPAPEPEPATPEPPVASAPEAPAPSPAPISAAPSAPAI